MLLKLICKPGSSGSVSARTTMIFWRSIVTDDNPLNNFHCYRFGCTRRCLELILCAASQPVCYT
jgi:hypothetical protein